MRLPLLILHISAGTLGIRSGFVAMSFRKGSSPHRAAGNVFFISMLSLSACGSFPTRFSSLVLFRGGRYCERHCLGLSWEDLMVGVHQIDPYLVRARRHPGQVDRIDIARVRP